MDQKLSVLEYERIFEKRVGLIELLLQIDSSSTLADHKRVEEKKKRAALSA